MYKNNVLLSTAYHASYVHDIYKASDTIKLVVIKGNYTDTLIKYQLFDLSSNPVPYTGWKEKPTNINDQFKRRAGLGQLWSNNWR